MAEGMTLSIDFAESGSSAACPSPVQNPRSCDICLCFICFNRLHSPSQTLFVPLLATLQGRIERRTRSRTKTRFFPEAYPDRPCVNNRSKPLDGGRGAVDHLLCHSRLYPNFVVVERIISHRRSDDCRQLFTPRSFDWTTTDNDPRALGGANPLRDKDDDHTITLCTCAFFPESTLGTLQR